MPFLPYILVLSVLFDFNQINVSNFGNANNCLNRFRQERLLHPYNLTSNFVSSKYKTYEYWNEMCVILSEIIIQFENISSYSPLGLPPKLSVKKWESIINRIENLPTVNVDIIAVENANKIIKGIEYLIFNLNNLQDRIGVFDVRINPSASLVIAISALDKIAAKFKWIDTELDNAINLLEGKYPEMVFKKPMLFRGQSFNPNTILLANNIKVLKNVDSDKYEIIKEVEIVVCEQLKTINPYEKADLFLLKLYAVQFDADAIVDIVILKSKTCDICTNCMIVNGKVIKLCESLDY